MPTIRSPRRGSLQFWPRKKAKKIIPRIRSWAKSKEGKILGFLGYKAGMTHINMRDNSESVNKGNMISVPVTVIECPPLRILGIRFYKKRDDVLNPLSMLLSSKIDKELARKIKIKKSQEPKEFDDLRLVVYSQPKLIGIGKKKPDLFELEISGDKETKLKIAKEYLDKEIKLNDVFNEGNFVDVHGVTTGKGFQGTVKRYGVIIRQHKSEKTKRGIGTLGAWTPKRVSYTVPQPGKMGYHLRTEYNKWLLKTGDKPEEINPKGGFLHYGLIKNNYLLLKGSIPGPVKRPIILTEPIRPKNKGYQIEIKTINLRSKQ